jgi:hypothetical protein
MTSRRSPKRFRARPPSANEMKLDRHSIVEPTKHQLHELADALLLGEADAKEAAITFFEQNSEGVWHNRARAMIARRMKNLSLADDEKRRVVEVVKDRLAKGKIPEQFRDQLTMALFFDRAGTLNCAEKCLSSAKPYVVRFARWVLKQTETEREKLRPSAPHR